MLTKELWLSIYLLCHDFLASISGNSISQNKLLHVLLWSFQARRFLWWLFHFFGTLALNSFLVLNWRCAFHNITSLFLVVPQWSIHLAWNTFLRHLLNQIACCAQPYWDSLCDSFYFFPQREYHPSPGKFYSQNLALWNELLSTNVVFRQNARFQILSHGFDVSLKLK